jgi:hypothetical protein
MNHIDEGVAILDAIGANLRAKEAYCLHPIYQGEERPSDVTDEAVLDSTSILLAIEYKRVANAYLSQHYVSENDAIELSSIAEVNAMLIADKVQNRKDFELYHKGTHPKSRILDGYFKNWLRKLGVSEDEYQALRAVCDPRPVAH